MTTWLLAYLKTALSLSIFELLWAFGFSIAIAGAMSLISRFLYRHLYTEYGRKAVLALIYTTSIGTIMHELSHALFCVIFEHKVTKISLFNPEPDGTLGYVEHAYNNRNDYQAAGNFFIGIAPILMAGVMSYLLMVWLMPDIIPPAPDTHNIHGIVMYIEDIYRNILITNNLANWHFWLFGFLMFAIAGHSTLSPADMKGALSGIVALIILVFLINTVSIWIPGAIDAEFHFLVQYYAVFYGSMLFGLSLYVGLMGVLLLIKILI